MVDATSAIHPTCAECAICARWLIIALCDDALACAGMQRYSAINLQRMCVFRTLSVGCGVAALASSADLTNLKRGGTRHMEPIRNNTIMHCKS